MDKNSKRAVIVGDVGYTPVISLTPVRKKKTSAKLRRQKMLAAAIICVPIGMLGGAGLAWLNGLPRGVQGSLDKAIEGVYPPMAGDEISVSTIQKAGRVHGLHLMRDEYRHAGKVCVDFRMEVTKAVIDPVTRAERLEDETNPTIETYCRKPPIKETQSPMISYGDGARGG